MLFALPFRRRAAWTAAACAATFMSAFAAPRPALAWGAGGHMMGAQIAYARLTPRAKAEVDRLLALPINPAEQTSKSLDFVNASHWPDDVRRLPGFEATAPDHYVDIPFTTDGTPLPANQPEAENVIVALTRYVAVLQSATAKDEEKAAALRFVIHYVGDVHQPLHCTTLVTRDHPQGDKGGNEVEVSVALPSARGEDGAPVRGGGVRSRSIKLHSYWDQGLRTFPPSGANFAPPPLALIPPAVARATTANPASDPAWQTGGPFGYTRWMNESAWLARNFVYSGLKNGRTPSAPYIREGVRICNKRVAWSGYRLAALLNAVYSGEAAPAVPAAAPAAVPAAPAAP